jgi:dienelactone hydrolase
VVLSLHGCSGPYDNRGRLGSIYSRDSVYFNREGIHLLALDSFAARGVKSICETPARQRTVDVEDRRLDVHAALRWLAARPEVDATRLAVVGRSHGGSTVLAVLDRSVRSNVSQPLKLRAAVALYPGCAPAVRELGYEIASPLLILIGADDDWTPAPPCRDLRDKLQRAQKDAVLELVVYPDSHHGFDGLGPVRVRPNVQTRSGTATVGGNPQAREAAYRRMFEFLARELDAPLALTHEERFAR